MDLLDQWMLIFLVFVVWWFFKKVTIVGGRIVKYSQWLLYLTCKFCFNLNYMAESMWTPTALTASSLLVAVVFKSLMQHRWGSTQKNCDSIQHFWDEPEWTGPQHQTAKNIFPRLNPVARVNVGIVCRPLDMLHLYVSLVVDKLKPSF